MARKVRAREAEEQALDLTPMLDVTFILLIFFIVTAQFIKLPGVDISRTDAENDNNIAPLGIIIAIDENSDVFVAREKIELNELEFTIRELREGNSKGEIVLQVDNASEAGVLDTVMQAIVSADPESAVNVSTELD
ncbi:biopolymer transporter ExbD [Ponticaulis sp.]|uniref:ExbD/TolR family protein n=1 Tax=Ponticaulis sp. TaxID=2020902 RepID=UPI000B71CE87|nr:biopolymer transporter ExbD [Ponticaulis sp.]MAJ08864.1 biopolymer transporter ExbD [Ponticaulis sp.]RPG17554.1 MAG: biopolymer transporter ExbD [Hyphomonadaceae bacterium TMED125]HBH88432.1 biopolymer transporter ExbD [Hyphomonadaceae bacterium]|tara:strand:- start:9074 stop:9481 length:408 start_codon:yes stop_codon:yes gene_type:complete